QASGITRFNAGTHLLAEVPGSPTEVSLENLADVHTARNTEGVEDNVNRRAVFEEGHIFCGHDPRDDTLVAVAAGHLVADLELALDRDVDLHLLVDARLQVVALMQLLDLVLEAQSDRLNLLVEVGKGSVAAALDVFTCGDTDA